MVAECHGTEKNSKGSGGDLHDVEQVTEGELVSRTEKGLVLAAACILRKKEEGSLKAGRPLHGLKLINALFGVALPDLAQGLVFVSSQSHVLSMDHVIGSLLGLISGIGQL